jgi:hypothetical protein
MKKIILLTTFLLLIIGIKAQEGNIGIMAGVAYYNGEVNPQKLFYMPSPAFSVIYRHNFNDRYSLRFQGDYSTVQGNDAKSSNAYQQWRNYSFKNTIWDIGFQLELNFMDYNKNYLKTKYFTPYISTGVYMTYEPQSEIPIFVSIPIEFGFKYAINKQVTAGIQWDYRWNNSDYVDGLKPDVYTSSTKQLSYNPDMDLISFAQVFFTVNLFKEDVFCPAY